METGGQTSSGDRRIDLLWRQVGRPALETGGQTSSKDRYTGCLIWRQMDRPFYGDIWKGLVRRQVDGPALETGGYKPDLKTREKTCSRNRRTDLLWRQMDRPVLEADGQICYGDRGTKLTWRHVRRPALETDGQTGRRTDLL